MRFRAPHSLIAVAGLIACSQQQAPPGKWAVPAAGPALTQESLAQLSGKTCWGYFDRGTNSDSARGAVFAQFAASKAPGQLWIKWGKEARETPRQDGPNGYIDMGRTTPPVLTAAGTEITFRTNVIFPSGSAQDFDWFVRPTDGASYVLRAVATVDQRRGATGILSCRS